MKLLRQSLRRPAANYQSGVSLPELTAVVALIGVLAGITVPTIKFGRSPLADSSNRISSVLKLSRSRAMAQTSAYRISPIDARQLLVERSTSCTASSWNSEAALSESDLKLDQGVAITIASENGSIASDPGSGWDICFDSRGYANKTLTLTLNDSSRSQQVQIFRGGTVAVQ